MTRAILLTPSYPHPNRLYDSPFIHSRVLGYRAAGLAVEVKVVGGKQPGPPYEFEGVPVETFRAEELAYVLRDRRPDVVLVHFLQRGWMEALSRLSRTTRVVVWIHGSEALGWHRRLFNFGLTREFLGYVYSNARQLVALHRFVGSCQHRNVTFVFVSKWMRRTTESDAWVTVDNAAIIPNPIDTDWFYFEEKPAELRNRVLLIRSFDSRKYANDVAVAAIMELGRHPAFGDLQFSIFGRGRDFHALTDGLARFPNVRREERFLDHREIKREHGAHGLFLCPTRQDAQGVSMCEAMASGLVPLTSRSTAIPEFVHEGQTGFLAADHHELAGRILELHANPGLFAKLSRAAAEAIEHKCAARKVIAAELDLILGRPA